MVEKQLEDKEVIQGINRFFRGTKMFIFQIANVPGATAPLFLPEVRLPFMLVLTRTSFKAYDSAFVGVSPWDASGCGFSFAVNGQWYPIVPGMPPFNIPPLVALPNILKRANWETLINVLIHPNDPIVFAGENAGVIACDLELTLEYCEYDAQVLQHYTDADILRHAKLINK